MANNYRNLMNLPQDELNNSLSLWISFKRIAVLEMEQIVLINGPNFVSSVGGNLGLFLGFSFFSTAIDVLEWLKNTLPKKVNRK